MARFRMKRRSGAGHAADASEPESSGASMVSGVVMLALAGIAYWYFTDFESSQDESRRMNAIVALIYTIGGKWLVIGVCLLASAASFIKAASPRRSAIRRRPGSKARRP